jgi:ZIP family zinc transporter
MLAYIALAAFAVTLLGGFFALRLRDRLHLVLGFSAGAVVGVAFFDLIPEALELAGTTTKPSTITAIIGLGFALYLLLDRMVVLHHNHDDNDSHGHTVRGIWGAGTLSFHSFLDGLGIGLAFQASPTIGLVVTAAVLVHDFSDGINTVNMIIKNGGERLSALRWLALDALAPVAGITAAMFISVSQQQLGFLLALFAGFFLYIGASDLLPESHHAHPVRWTTIATVIGMATMYVIIRLAA